MFSSYSLRIGKVMGIPIEINYTWLFIFGLIALTLSTSYFPAYYPSLSTLMHWILGFLATIIFFISVLLHELSHCYVAKKNGIPIRGITLFIFGGVAKIAKEPDKPSVELVMAVAGPAMSIALSIFFGLIWLGAYYFAWGKAIVALCGYLALINGMLAVFNLIPGFPLDGGRVLRAIIWYFTDNLRLSTRIASYVGEGIAGILILYGLIVIFLGQVIVGIWYAFIGWFLIQAAEGSYQQVVFRRALTGLQARDIASMNFQAVNPEITLDHLVNEYFLHSHYTSLPVIANDNLLGLISVNEVKKIPREQWGLTRVSQIITPVEEDTRVNPELDALAVLEKMSQKNLSEIYVMDREKIIGIINKHDLMQYLKRRMDLGT